MRALILLLALAAPAEAHDDPELRCLTRAEYVAKVLEPKARLVACLEDVDTERDRAEALALDLRQTAAALERAERARRRDRVVYGVGGALVSAAVFVVVGRAIR